MTAKNKQALSWLQRAQSDLQYAKAGERETQQHHITCFLCQQVVEKALKGLLVAAGEIPERTHSLGRLATLAEKHFPKIKSHVAKLRKLDKYYITARYPDDLSFDFSKEDAAQALEIATSIVQLAEKLLVASVQ